MHEFDLPEHLVVDFSHGNCQKQHRRQLEVCDDICQQIRNGSTAIAGIMAESFLREGTQKIISGQPLIYGQSITDPCLNWEDTEVLLEKLAAAVPGWAFLRCVTRPFLSARVYHSAELALAVIALIIDNNNHCEFDY